MAGAPAGFNDLINRKYDIAQTTADANAALANANAGQVAANAASQRDVQSAEAAHTRAVTGEVDPLAQASIRQTNAGIGQTNAQTGLIGAETDVQRDALQPLPDEVLRSIGLGLGYPEAPRTNNVIGGAPSAPVTGLHWQGRSILDQQQQDQHYAFGTANVRAPQAPQPPQPSPPGPGQTVTNGTWGSPTPNQDLRKRLGYKEGVSKVPGKGSGKVDTVPAMLAPGEAVLNAPAARKMGRGMIAKANKEGERELSGKSVPQGAASVTAPNTSNQSLAMPNNGPPPGFNKGTAKVTKSRGAPKGDAGAAMASHLLTALQGGMGAGQAPAPASGAAGPQGKAAQQQQPSQPPAPPSLMSLGMI